MLVSHRSRAPITRMKAGPLRATVVMMLCMMMKLPLRQALRTSATTTAPRMMVNSYSDERRLIRGVLAEAVEAQGRIRDALEQQLLKKQPALVSTASDDDEKASRAREKALRRAEMVPIRLAEVGEREEALAELQIRLGEATDSAGIDGLKRDMQEIGLGNLLESFDVDAPARGIWGRPDDFEGLVVSSPKHGIPILISRQRHSDSVLRRVSRGTDLWFQAREGRGSRVLLRTSMRRNLSKSPRECMEVAAAYAAFFSDVARTAGGAGTRAAELTSCGRTLGMWRSAAAESDNSKTPRNSGSSRPTRGPWLKTRETRRRSRAGFRRL